MRTITYIAAAAGTLLLPLFLIGQTVRTESGLLAGVPSSDPSIRVFKGVPYAAPPVGDGRWRAPQPAPKWQGVRAADHFGANCIQTIVEEKKPWTHEFMAHGEVSEDCLFLNLWTAAAPGERRPVFVYLHGGANTEGSGSIDAYNGEGLARKGLVMVTINYRLGVFGFFAHPELSRETDRRTSGNYALLDQIAALAWIHRNIAAFGGDPDRVTVAGQSAGASDINLLLVSPLAKGLFHRAIMESGGAPGAAGGRALSAAEADGVKFAEAKGAHSLAELRARPWKEIFAPVQGIRFGPIVDGVVVPGGAEPADIPVLTGSNADENGASPVCSVTAAQFADQARQRYGDRAAEFLRLYPVSNDEEACSQTNRAARDRQRTMYAEWAANRAATVKAAAYLYFYEHALPGPDAAKYGSFHTSEVPFVLNTLSHSDRPFTDKDREIAETLSRYWANFAAGGDPNGTGLAHWPTAGEKPRAAMKIGDEDRPIEAASEARYEFFRSAANRP